MLKWRAGGLLRLLKGERMGVPRAWVRHGSSVPGFLRPVIPISECLDTDPTANTVSFLEFWNMPRLILDNCICCLHTG